jgi:hypothetical protein
MVKSATKPTLIAQKMPQTRSSFPAFQSKPKHNSALANSSKTACRLLSENALNTRRPKQKSRGGGQVGAVHTVDGKGLSKDNNILNKSPKNREDLESRIRSALSQSGLRVPASPPSITRSTKSVRFDPAIVFCRGLDVSESSSTQETRFQAGIEAILKCKKSERERLRRILHALTGESENKKPYTEEVIKGTLNPRASAFLYPSTLQPRFPLKDVGAQISHPPVGRVRKFHPRTVLDPHIFGLQTSALGRKPERTQSPAKEEEQNSDSSGILENPNYIHQPSITTSTIKRNSRKTLQSKLRKAHIPRNLSCGYANFHHLHPIIDAFDDSGRVAHAIDPPWAQAILNNFVQKYPMTGFLNPALPLMTQCQHTAEVQQMLEYIIMQKKEMAVLMGDSEP